MVTGASMGIGKAIAEGFAREGYCIAICARNERNLNETARELQLINPGITILAYPANLSSKKEALDFAEAVRGKFGRIDVLVNNAGEFKSQGSMINEDDDLMEDMMRLNFFSAYYLSKNFGKLMIAQGSGHIINIVSIAGKEAYPAGGSYSISKFAQMGLSKNLCLELKPHHIKVTSILPGPTLTRAWEAQKPNPAKFILPEDISKVVLNCVSLSFGANLEEVEIRPLI